MNTDRKNTLQVRIKGMDCAECAAHVRSALLDVEHVRDARVLLGAEKALIMYENASPSLSHIQQAVSRAGYEALPQDKDAAQPRTQSGDRLTRRLFELLALVTMLVVFITVVGEWLGVFENLLRFIPRWVWMGVIAAGGWPVFKNVFRAAKNGRVISHTLMTLGVIAAAAVGAWTSAVVVVLFMRVGDFVESFTTDKARAAIKDLAKQAPQYARIEVDGREVMVPIHAVKLGDRVVVRPGERIPVDGEVVAGQASVNQASMTGESMPVDKEAGSRVYAATIAQAGMLTIRTTAVGEETTFGHILRLVEEAEGNRADVQRAADKFAGYYLPVVITIAALTLMLSRDVLAAAAVLVVACSCSFALATPVAMLAAMGSAAKQGLLIKGGKVLERLAKVDAVFVDKTGTLTAGKPVITDMIAFEDMQEDEVLRLAAAVERYSEHPLAQAVREEAEERGLQPPRVHGFVSLPGIGVRARMNGHLLSVVNQASLEGEPKQQEVESLRAQGKALLYVQVDDRAVGVLAAADVLRQETKQAIQELTRMGIQQIMLLSGDHETAARILGDELGIAYRAGLLPQDKIQMIKDAQAQGHVVAMVGDGVNDAPALAQADVGIAMGLSGSDLANESAMISLLREDWRLIPQAFSIARRAMRVVRTNIMFTAAYNLMGLSLAALGFLPPGLAAALQSLPDVGILANSARLVKPK